MGTRAVVARQCGDGFEGRYLHDGDVFVVLHDLRTAYQALNSDADTLLSVIVDEHTGWSSLNGDWLKSPRWDNPSGFGPYTQETWRDVRNAHAPVCYCHGDRWETGDSYTHESSPAFYEDIEFVYVISRSGIVTVMVPRIVVNYLSFYVLGTVDLNTTSEEFDVSKSSIYERDNALMEG